LLRGFVPASGALAADLQRVIARAPFRHMVTPDGLSMSVAMTNCGASGWVSDRSGYRYDPIDPESGKPWPSMPESFLRLAGEAAGAAGFEGFSPDACLINHYQVGAKLSLHQDKDERDFGQPIVSVSLGVPATFLFGGLKRAGKTLRVARHGSITTAYCRSRPRIIRSPARIGSILRCAGRPDVSAPRPACRSPLSRDSRRAAYQKYICSDFSSIFFGMLANSSRCVRKFCTLRCIRLSISSML